MTFEKFLFASSGRPVDQMHDHVAIEQRPSLFRQPRQKSGRKRVDARDGRDSQDEAGEKDPKSRQARAHFATRKPKSQKNCAHAARASATMRPSFNRTMRPQRLAKLSSWVTRNSVGRERS